MKKEQTKQEQARQVSDPKFPVSLLIKSESIKCFGLHCDIIRAILYLSEYTIKDAKQAIQKYLNSFN